MRELEDARYKAIGARIRDVRIEKNMSQAELAEKGRGVSDAKDEREEKRNLLSSLGLEIKEEIVSANPYLN